ncbi:MAG: hypothetical protein O2819_03295 [Planctomycetota bacterium]|nr:hypothetical protein [Planctomycetota bacterium]MDA1105764.1 hypothetical protein [Planctomycetota bacterium]
MRRPGDGAGLVPARVLAIAMLMWIIGAIGVTIGDSLPIVLTQESVSPLAARIFTVWWAGLAVALPIGALLYGWCGRALTPSLLCTTIFALAAAPLAWMAGWPSGISLTLVASAFVTTMFVLTAASLVSSSAAGIRALLAAVLVLAATLGGSLEVTLGLASSISRGTGPLLQLGWSLSWPAFVPVAAALVLRVASGRPSR